MTLLRQLIIVMSLIFVVLFASSMVVSVLNAQRYIEEQLAGHAQDSATSLSLSIQNGSDMDPIIIERMIAVAFDRGGLYQRIAFSSEELGNIVKEVPMGAGGAPVVEGVPNWFLSLVQISSPSATELVSNGWYEVGDLTVVSSPEGAYRDLWRITREQLRTFLIVLFLACVLMAFILRLVLRPLAEVEQQAVAISERDFRVLERIPRTRELRSVVLAMNRMVEKLKKIFNEQVELAERFRAQSLRDPVTGLGNRREFDSRLKAHMASEQGSGIGTVFFLAIGGFGKYNEEQGHVAGDLLLEQVAQVLVTNLQEVTNVAIARNAGANFNAFLPNLTAEKATEMVEKCYQAITNLHVFQEVMPHNSVHIGASYSDEKRDVKALLSECDMALRESQGRGVNCWVMYQRQDASTQRDKPVRQAGEWQCILARVLNERALIFHYQPAFSIPDRTVLHHEVLARIELDGEVVSAGGFLPMAERFNLLPQFDRLIIELALEQLEQHPGVHLCVNISPHSLESPEFVDWVRENARGRTGLERLILEVPEYSVQTRAEQVRRLVALSRELGAQMSIDHFGVGAATFSYLQSLRVQAVKVDRSFIRDIHTNQDNQFFVQSMAQIAHGQDIALYAEGVESDEEWKQLVELGLDGGMGFGLQRPGPDLSN